MSAHPPHCAGCRGTDWRPGPPRVQRVAGRRIEYSTVVRCDHPHWHDDPSPPDHLEREHQAAQAAFAQGYAEGLADLERMHQETPNA